MDYAALSPHVGSWALRDDHLGDSSLRGGAVNWSSLGSRLSSALSSTGRWLVNTGNRFVHSNTFQQLKQGIQDSGVIRNAANLAGETLNSLADIGRLKLQQDIERLRRKALGEEGPANQAELLALIQALQAQVAAGQGSNTSPPAAPAGPATPEVPMTLVPTTRPIPEMVTEVRPPPAANTPSTLEYLPTRDRRRKRPRPANWRARLNAISGSGVATTSKRMCY